MKPKHYFTVDLEEWFHIVGSDCPNENTWNDFAPLIEPHTSRILTLLDEYETKATFFILGWIADKYPDLVKRIADFGHELACHGYGHQSLLELTPDEFDRDTEKALAFFEKTGLPRPIGYRAASYSITPETKWVFEKLFKYGFKYDASVFPARRDLGGYRGAPSQPYKPIQGEDFWEFPVTMKYVYGKLWPFSAGGYLRITPLNRIVRWTREIERDGGSVTFVLHPRDIAKELPPIAVNRLRRFRMRASVGDTEKKLRKIFEEFDLGPIRSLLDNDEKEV
ncbi:MAG: DUF3473 domain-containing protein [bacterium]|nr:DUF3473 domain-containing protein [bacterium]